MWAAGRDGGRRHVNVLQPQKLAAGRCDQHVQGDLIAGAAFLDNPAGRHGTSVGSAGHYSRCEFSAAVVIDVDAATPHGME